MEARAGVFSLVLVLLVAACYTGPGIDHYSAVLDGLAIPDSWQLIKSETRGPEGDFACDPMVIGTCPAVTRSYVVKDDPSAAFSAAEAVVTAAGFDVYDELLPDCSGSPSASACAFFSSRGADHVLITVFRSVKDAGLSDAPSEGTTLHVVATGNP